MNTPSDDPRLLRSDEWAKHCPREVISWTTLLFAVLFGMCAGVILTAATLIGAMLWLR